MSAVLAPRADVVAPRFVDAAFLQDPYPTYAALRAAGPLLWSEEFFGGAWLLTRHADVEAVLRDATRFSAQRTGAWVMRDEDARDELRGFQRLFARAMLFLDGGDHARLRRVLLAGFRPDALQRLAPRIAQCADELMAALDARAGFDAMTEIARVLPARVIAEMMGIDRLQHDEFTRWCEDLAVFIGATEPSRDSARRAQESLLAMAAFFEQLVACRRARPGDDLVSLLLQAEGQGDVRGNAELLAQCAMLLFAGYETTRNLLGNGLHALLTHRPQWHRLQREPALLPAAIRELLRFDSPVQYTGRRVATDLVMHGQHLRRGDLVIALIGSANRDESRYPNAHELDIASRTGAMLSFGSGAHVCIGAALTQLEAEIVFSRLLQRWPRLQLADEAPVRWHPNAVYRGLERLWVREAA